MNQIKQRILGFDWQEIADRMHQNGFAIVPGMVTDEDCQELIQNYTEPGFYRKTISMERYRFGMGEYKYFAYPLPQLLQEIRQETYAKLAPVANRWMDALKIDKQFPEEFNGLQQLCHEHNQTKPTVLILKYGKGGYNTMHQDLYGDVFFPIQAVLFLNEPGKDYTGGEFVLMQQNPRAQSKAIVLKPQKGDMLLFTTNFRPVKGSKGFYRVNVKHGVSELLAGQRHTVGIIFHDALN